MTEKPSKFAAAIAALEARGLPIPFALAGEPEPLSLTVRDEVEQWASAHGYDKAAIKLLVRAIRGRVWANQYLAAVGADLSVRVDLDGAPAGPVSEMDRLSANLTAHARAMKEQFKAPARAPEAATTPKPPGTRATLSLPQRTAMP
jgi:sRNA-binding protein